MQITVDIPEELAANITAPGHDPSRAGLEALGLEAYRQRRISANSALFSGSTPAGTSMPF